MLPSYVYLHKDPITQEIRYVGAGSKGRAWACGWSSKGGARRGNRTQNHQLWLNSLFDKGYTMGDIVVIVDQGLRKGEAHVIEKEEILRHDKKFLFNRELGKALLSLSSDQVSFAKKLRKNGLSYKKISKEVGSSTMTMYRLLNGRTKYYG